MILNKSSIMLTNFISRTCLHKDMDMLLEIQKVKQLQKMRNNLKL